MSYRKTSCHNIICSYNSWALVKVIMLCQRDTTIFFFTQQQQSELKQATEKDTSKIFCAKKTSVHTISFNV